MTERQAITGLDHVTNICTDMEETKAFYEEEPGSGFVEPPR